MANLVRSAKPASEWTTNDLEAYNIMVQYQDTSTFLGVDQMPAPKVDQELLTTKDAEAMVSDDNCTLICLLDLAMELVPEEKSAVVDFARMLLRCIGYAIRPRIVRSRMGISLLVSGDRKDAITDVCLLHGVTQEIFLVVQEDKRYRDVTSDPTSQLIAQAIAAFDHNNQIRKETSEAILEYKVMPGIVFAGTSPIFYKIPVTSGFVHHVRNGTYPPETTIVSAYIPSASAPDRCYSEGMKPLNNRLEILSCYEAFKGVVVV